MNIDEFFLGCFAGLFTIIGLLALGNSLNTILKIDNSKFTHISFGLGLYYLLFISVSLLLPTKAVHLFFIVLFSVCVVLNRLYLRKVLFSLKKHFTFTWLALLLILAPFIFRLLSPPTSADGLSFYLPSVEWVYTNGLAFNPYLTNYTTMPMAAEYLFSLPFGIGGQFGIRFLDFIFSLLLLQLLYSLCLKLMSKNSARIVICCVLLLPGTLFFLLGSGKIDTLNACIFLSGFSVLIRKWKEKKYQGAILIFSIALSIKYTNWLLLILPLIILNLKLFAQKPKAISLVFPLMAIVFAGSVLVKNQIQVNNPLAPLYSTSKESRFIKSHGEIKQYSHQPLIVDKKINTEGYISLLQKSIPLILLGLFIVAFMVLFFRQKNTKLLYIWVAFLVASLIPWFYFLGNSSQPFRFILTQLIIIIIIPIQSYDLLIASVSKRSKIAITIPLTFLFIILLGNSYLRHGHLIKDFFLSQKLELADWYEEVGRDHYSASTKFIAQGFQYEDVNYKVPVSLGSANVDGYGKIPTDEEYANRRTNKKTSIKPSEYVFDLKSRLIRANLDTCPVIFSSGNYYLVKVCH